jgi:hypothetical protein
MARYEDYQIISDKTHYLSEGRRNASQTYLAVNTAVIAVMAFLLTDANLHGWSLVVVNLPLFLVGAAVCYLWFRIIVKFRAIIGWHFEQLRAMEHDLQDCRAIFSREYERFYQMDGKEFSFSDWEAWLPRTLILLYVVYGLGIVAAAALNMV